MSSQETQADGDNKNECRKCPVHLVLQKTDKTSPNLQETVHITGSTLFGRQTGKVDVIIDSKRYPCLISRVHCKLEQHDDEFNINPIWILTDLQSKNGLVVNSKAVDTKQILKNNDIIVFGGRGCDPSKPTFASDIVYKFSINSALLKKRKSVEREDEEQPVAKKQKIEDPNVIDLSEEDSAKEKRKELELTEVKNSFNQQIASIAKELENIKTENEKLKGQSAALPDSLADEFSCVVCQELFIEPVTLTCSHTFCSHCIESWVKIQRVCPVCRAPIADAPVKSVSLEGILAKTIAALPPAQQEEYAARKEKRKVEEAEKFKQLNTLISNAKKDRLNFLKIQDTWTDREKSVFSRGVKGYTKGARELYCSTTGLTRKFLQAANANQLRIACRNVGIPVRTGLGAAEELQLMRSDLLKFLTSAFS